MIFLDYKLDYYKTERKVCKVEEGPTIHRSKGKLAIFCSASLRYYQAQLLTPVEAEVYLIAKLSTQLGQILVRIQLKNWSEINLSPNFATLSLSDLQTTYSAAPTPVEAEVSLILAFARNIKPMCILMKSYILLINSK